MKKLMLYLDDNEYENIRKQAFDAAENMSEYVRGRLAGKMVPKKTEFLSTNIVPPQEIKVKKVIKATKSLEETKEEALRAMRGI